MNSIKVISSNNQILNDLASVFLDELDAMEDATPLKIISCYDEDGEYLGECVIEETLDIDNFEMN